MDIVAALIADGQASELPQPRQPWALNRSMDSFQSAPLSPRRTTTSAFGPSPTQMPTSCLRCRQPLSWRLRVAPKKPTNTRGTTSRSSMRIKPSSVGLRTTSLRWLRNPPSNQAARGDQPDVNPHWGRWGEAATSDRSAESIAGSIVRRGEVSAMFSDPSRYSAASADRWISEVGWCITVGSGVSLIKSVFPPHSPDPAMFGTLDALRLEQFCPAYLLSPS